MRELVDTPFFGIIISIAAYELGLILYRKTKLSILNPLLISIALVMAFLAKFNISLDSYNKGGDIISIFLGPATVILAVPLYKQFESLKANVVPITAGIFAGCVAAVSSVYLLARLFRLPQVLSLSLIPKSITTPIGIELSKQIGGIPPVTVAAIIITGIMGAVLGPFICKSLKITDSIAVGVALGTSSHAIGTTKAIELGEVEGAMSGLSIGVAGLITVFITLGAARFF